MHVRPGLLTMLECHFNKTTYHPKLGVAFHHVLHGFEKEEEEEFITRCN